MGSQPKTTVRPIRLHLFDRDLTTTIVRGVGYRAHCDCGWASERRKTYGEARDESKFHRTLFHPEQIGARPSPPPP